MYFIITLLSIFWYVLYTLFSRENKNNKQIYKNFDREDGNKQRTVLKELVFSYLKFW